MDTEFQKSEEPKKNKNFSLVKKIVTPLAESGHAKSQTRLGAIYYNGLGVKKDLKKWLEWYQKAAKQGYLSAKYNLGKVYFYGKAVPKDFKEAAKWFQLAAEQGNKDAKKALKIVEAELGEFGKS